MPRKKQDWKAGDVFAVPTLDGGFVVGQVLAHEPRLMNSVAVAFFDPKQSAEPTEIPDLTPKSVFSVLYATRDQLDSGKWKVIGHAAVEVPRNLLPHEDLRKSGFVGATVTGTKIIHEFLNAYHGLVPWDDWKDPSYLDGLLITPEKKPVGRLVYKNR